MLVEMEAGAAGAMRREVRRALVQAEAARYRRARRDRSSEQHPAPDTESEIIAMLSPIDGEGARIVWIVKPRMQGGLLRMWALISERDGLVGAQNTGCRGAN